MATSENRRYGNKTFLESTVFRQMASNKDDVSNNTVIYVQQRNGTDVEQNISTSAERSEHELVVLGVPLNFLSKSGQFCVCCGGVFVFYLIYGYVQVCAQTTDELLFSIETK